MQALLLLGGNMGDPTTTLVRAEALIQERCGKVLARSRDHWTEPWGFTSEQLFLNRALLIDTSMEPRALLPSLLAIETELGRVRSAQGGYASRTIDIDILLIDQLVVEVEGLIVPHPRMHQRAFALAPAADIAPNWIHPQHGRTVLQLLNDLRHPA